MRYRLLGPLEVIGEDGQSIALAGEKERALLATLVLRANTAVSTDRLVDALWGEDPPATAANALQVHVSRLRKKLAGAGAPDALASAPGGYLLRTRTEEVDAACFEEAVRAATGDPGQISLGLAQALAMWRGPALVDVGTGALDGERARLEELHLLASEQRIEAELALGRHGAVVAELEAMVRAEPLRERPRSQLMIALYRAGRQADALATYQETRRVLREELGIEPGPNLQALELAILRQDPELTAPAPAVVPPTSVGPPSGTLTLLISDVDGSARLWEEHPDEMALVMRRYDELLRTAIEDAGGYVFRAVGDIFCAAFATAWVAAEVAANFQLDIQDESRQSPLDVRVRMALHTGHCEEHNGNYSGAAVNRVARLASAAFGGQVVMSQTTADLLADTPEQTMQLRGLGLHRLKDLGRPEHVYQLLVPGLASTFPPLRSLDNPDLDNNLPVQLTSFIGRRREIGEIDSLVDQSRLVTLIGVGGVGKTRLALAVAAELLDGSGDGVWFVDLAPLADFELVPRAVASALGVREEPGRPVADTVVDALGGRRLLVVLDNCEHLLDACVKLVDHVLRACPNIHILATSREGLGLGGERLYRVPPLGLPGGAPSGESEAVALFVERARDHRPDFTLNEMSEPIVAELCRRLDGMPLAIELACARLRSMGLDDIEARLDERFRLLTGGSRSALPRQQTLRALIDWSYELLNELERTVLERVSVFAGGFDLRAAEAVAATDEVAVFDVPGIVGSLVEKSLVQADSNDGGDFRYRLLETIRQYATQRLEVRPPDARHARSAHFHYFLCLAEEAAPHLRSREQIRWLDRLDDEYDNLRLSSDFLRDDPANGEEALRFVVALSPFWHIRHLVEGQQALLEALERPRFEGDQHLRVAVLSAFGRLSSGFRPAEAYVTEAREMIAELQSPKLRAELLVGYAWHTYAGCSLMDFDEMTKEAFALARKTDDHHLIGRACQKRGMAAMYSHRLVDAATHYGEALTWLRSTGDPSEEAIALANLGLAELYANNLGTALERFDEVLTIARAIGDRQKEAMAQCNAALAALLDSELREAQDRLLLAIPIAQRAGFGVEVAYNLLLTGLLMSRVGRPRDAATLLGASDAAFDRLGAPCDEFESNLRDETLNLLSAALGVQFEVELIAGQALSTQDGVELALSFLEANAGSQGH